MTNGIISGTGNSRYLKTVPNALTLYPTWEAALTAMVAGTFPIDFNGINPSGWDVIGDKLGKETLLTDALCTALSLPTTATPTQAMDKLRTLVATAQSTANGKGNCRVATGSYRGTGKYNQYNKNTLILQGYPMFLTIGAGNNGSGIFIRSGNGFKLQSGSSVENSVIWSGTTLSWWSTSEYDQLNSSGVTYYYTYFY